MLARSSSFALRQLLIHSGLRSRPRRQAVKTRKIRTCPRSLVGDDAAEATGSLRLSARFPSMRIVPLSTRDCPRYSSGDANAVRYGRTQASERLSPARASKGCRARSVGGRLGLRRPRQRHFAPSGRTLPPPSTGGPVGVKAERDRQRWSIGIFHRRARILGRGREAVGEVNPHPCSPKRRKAGCPARIARNRASGTGAGARHRCRATAIIARASAAARA